MWKLQTIKIIIFGSGENKIIEIEGMLIQEKIRKTGSVLKLNFNDLLY